MDTLSEKQGGMNLRVLRDWTRANSVRKLLGPLSSSSSSPLLTYLVNVIILSYIAAFSLFLQCRRIIWTIQEHFEINLAQASKQKYFFHSASNLFRMIWSLLKRSWTLSRYDLSAHIYVYNTIYIRLETMKKKRFHGGRKVKPKWNTLPRWADFVGRSLRKTYGSSSDTLSHGKLVILKMI